MSECPLENPRGFYVAYLRGNDVDFTGYFCQKVKQTYKQNADVEHYTLKTVI